MRRFVLALCLSLWPALSWAQVTELTPFASPNLSGTVTGTYTLGGTPTITGLQSVNGWAPQWYLSRSNGAGAQISAGTSSGFAGGEVCTLSGGVETTNATVAVTSVSGGQPTAFRVQNPGNYSSVPTGSVSLSSCTSGTIGTMSLTGLIWVPYDPAQQFSSSASGDAGQTISGFNAAINALNLGLGNTINGYFSGGAGGDNSDGMGGGTGMTNAASENTFDGYLTGTQCTSCNWITAMGHHAFGHEVTGNKGVALGVDAAKWVTGSGYLTALSVDAAKFLQSPQFVVAIGGESTRGGQFISGITNAANSAGVCQVTVSSATGMLTGDTAVVTGIVGPTACNGVWTNVTVAGSNITLTGSTWPSIAYVSGGSVSDYGSVGLQNVAAVGYNTLSSSALRTVGRIALVGTNGLDGLTTGADIAAIGHNIGTGITSGNQLVLAGSSAGNTLTTGAGDVVIGYNANVTGSGVNDAVLIGGSSSGGGNGARGGAASVIIGNKSGNGSLTGTGVTSIGYSLATATCTTGGNLIFIGTNNNIDCGTNTDAHAILIATNTFTTAGSNTISIEGVFKATGTGTPATAAPTITGTVSLPNLSAAAGANQVCSGTGGILTTVASGTACASSAMRYKIPEGRIENGLGALATLAPSPFQYKDTERFGDRVHVGLYADDVQKMDPRCVVYDESGKLENYEDRCVLAYAVAAIQQQQHEIEGMRRYMGTGR